MSSADASSNLEGNVVIGDIAGITREKKGFKDLVDHVDKTIRPTKWKLGQERQKCW